MISYHKNGTVDKSITYRYSSMPELAMALDAANAELRRAKLRISELEAQVTGDGPWRSRLSEEKT